MKQIYSEDAPVEQPALVLLGQLGWETANLRRTYDLLTCPDERRGATPGQR